MKVGNKDIDSGSIFGVVMILFLLFVFGLVGLKFWDEGYNQDRIFDPIKEAVHEALTPKDLR